jgi:hypothetical protein
MKYLIVFLLVFAATSLRAQIKLEHQYPTNELRQFKFVTVDSGVQKYVDFNRNDSIYLYNLDHSLDRVIIIPQNYRKRFPLIYVISKRLFNIDDAYEYLIESDGTDNPANPSIRIYKENGDSLWGCNYCNGLNYGVFIFNTDNGSKMLINQSGPDSTPVQIAIYSLPGKLPGSTAKSSVNSPSIISGSSLPISAYPNPSNGQIRIEYQLPEGVATGELIITNADGIVVKKIHVGNIFNDILIEKSDLPSGSYFYKLVTEKGESEAKKIIVLK